MEKKRFQRLLAGLVSLSASQRCLLKAALHGEVEQASSLSAVGRKVGENRRCPHCAEPGAISLSTEGGIRRFRCKACWKTFRSTTGAALRGLHKKDKWLTFGKYLMDGLTLEASAQRCGIAVSTASRWRHRFLGTKDAKASKLARVVELDEIYLILKAGRVHAASNARAGGTASKRGLSAEQVPLPLAADRICTTSGAALSSVTTENVREALAPVIGGDIVLVTDGNSVYPSCA